MPSINCGQFDKILNTANGLASRLTNGASEKEIFSIIHEAH